MPLTHHPDAEFYTVEELAAWLRVSKMSIYRLIRRGEMDYITVGKSYRVSTDALDDYLERQMTRYGP
jgi:excisionase family DNA binding protein